MPDSLQTLEFGLFFNAEIKPNVLPDKIHTLILGKYFNKAIKPKVLPHNIRTLRLGPGFNQKIKYGVLPASLRIFEVYKLCQGLSYRERRCTTTFGNCRICILKIENNNT